MMKKKKKIIVDSMIPFLEVEIKDDRSRDPFDFSVPREHVDRCVINDCKLLISNGTRPRKSKLETHESIIDRASNTRIQWTRV